MEGEVGLGAEEEDVEVVAEVVVVVDSEADEEEEVVVEGVVEEDSKGLHILVLEPGLHFYAGAWGSSGCLRRERKYERKHLACRLLVALKWDLVSRLLASL